MATLEDHEDQFAAAFEAGRRAGLAVAALALACVAFLSLLGAEKAILAIALGTVAVRGGSGTTQARRFGLAAVCLGIVYLVAWVVLLALFWDQLGEFVRMLDKLS